MPNHCDNRLTVKGSEEDIAKFKKECIKVEDGNTLNFDFNAILPMPKELEETHAPSLFDHPDPELIEKYGTDNWYDWKVTNWGTKWGAYDYYLIDELDGELSFSFNTAWCPPNSSFIKAMADKYPNLEFEWYYFEGGRCFAGCYRAEDGSVFGDYYEGDGEYEEIGREIFGYDDYFDDQEE